MENVFALLNFSLVIVYALPSQDAEDMFRVFARFNPLLTRTRVRTAVKEFQIQLISTVGKSVERLQSKFTQRYESSSASRIARVRGIPPISGKILWARQMENQVKALMQRMGDVLGANWGQHLEGRQLRRSCDELRSKLDARAYFRGWVSEWERELSSDAATRLNTYPIVVVPEGPSGAHVAKVNFDERHEFLFRELRMLKWLGYEGDHVPRTLTIVSEEALGRYPFAMALKTALRSYTAVRELITPELEPLVLPQLQAVRGSISEAFDTEGRTKRRVRWGAKDVSDWVAGLTEHVSRFEERVETLLRACDKVNIALDLLGKVQYDLEKFGEVVTTVQKTVDELSLAGYTELAGWVEVVDERMGVVLGQRLEGALKEWCSTFKVTEKELSGDNYDEDEEDKTDGGGVAASGPMSHLHVSEILVEILLRNQEISASPAVPTVRAIFLNVLHDYIGIVCGLPRPTSGRFEVFGTTDGGNAEGIAGTFDRLVGTVSPQTLSGAYGVIEQHIMSLSVFVNQWLAYQILWDTRVSDVAAAMGEDMVRWHSLLIEATEARTALDSAASLAKFGPVAVRYDKVQSQINLKYDSWQKELQSSFAAILSSKINGLHDTVSEAKTKMEYVSLDATSASTTEIVLGVTFLQETKQMLDPWGKEVVRLIESERLLKRQRHAFRQDWMEASRAKGQYKQMEQALNKRNRTVDEQIPLLQSRVIAEDKISSQKSAEVMGKWEEEKPLRGNMKPGAALEVLTKFEFSLKKAKLDYENLVKAKDALGIEAAAGAEDSVSDCLDELSDLKEVWQAVSGSHSALDDLKDTPWATAVMRKLRKALDNITEDLRSLPNRVRQYDAFTVLNDTIKGYLSGQGVLSDLKTDALKERHWKTILSRLGIRVPYSELTIGHLWDNGVIMRKKEMGEILSVAQGEMALEVFLSQIRDRWMKQELELVLYQNRVRLIRGWDDLFATLDDHMGGLILMKSSPYYRSVREFQEEGKLWEDRLTKLRSAFDAWIDVQKRWVYLEGILFGSADIKAQLPAEWSRFKSVDGEFVTLMRRISGRPFAMEVLNIDNVHRTLERLGNLMGVIQKALGEYLEKQRSDFSRFYFLGDDDLLEIIGNAGEPGKVLGHIGKMFAGMASARLDMSEREDEDVIARLDAMLSKDGEIVPLDKVVDVTAKLAVKEWLKKLETGMHTTLAKLLQGAVTDDASSSLDATSDEGKAMFVEWAMKFPAQVMILATLINWSMGVDAALHEEVDCKTPLQEVLVGIEGKLQIMAQTVLLDLPSEARKKFEQLITELVHQRDVTRSLIDDMVSSPNDFRWLYHLRFSYNPSALDLAEKLQIGLSNANFFYGFEYLGIGERLVQTPLTDRCYLTLTQALHFRMGGNPFGPAGTGKTESVKALGSQLGRFVVVMNCKCHLFCLSLLLHVNFYNFHVEIDYLPFC